MSFCEREYKSLLYSANQVKGYGSVNVSDWLNISEHWPVPSKILLKNIFIFFIHENYTTPSEINVYW